jgi:hypothetical protein
MKSYALLTSESGAVLISLIITSLAVMEKNYVLGGRLARVPVRWESVEWGEGWRTEAWVCDGNGTGKGGSVWGGWGLVRAGSIQGFLTL